MHHHAQLVAARAFILVELLVTISIISLMLAILLPSLHTARLIAMRVKCSAEEHQVFQASNQYGNENDDLIPIGYVSESGGQGIYQGNDYLAHNEGPTVMLGVLWNTEHITTPQLYYCPTLGDGSENYEAAFATPGELPWWNVSGKVVRSTMFSRPAVKWADGEDQYLVLENYKTDEVTKGFPKFDDFYRKTVFSCDPYQAQAPHLGGLNATRGDGSVHFVPYTAYVDVEWATYQAFVDFVHANSRGSINNLWVRYLYQIMDEN